MVLFLSLYYHQSLPQKSVSIAWLTMFWCSLNEIKGKYHLVKCAHITFFGVSPGLRCHKTHWKVLWWINNFLEFLKWCNVRRKTLQTLQPLAFVSVNEEITLLLRKWHRYPALNGFQKAKTIQCCTRQIVSNLGQRKQISNKKGPLVN